MKTAIRVKQELNRRKNLLGDKRAEVAVLLDDEAILKGHDLSNTEEKFQNDANNDRGRKNQNRNHKQGPK